MQIDEMRIETHFNLSLPQRPTIALSYTPYSLYSITDYDVGRCLTDTDDSLQALSTVTLDDVKSRLQDLTPKLQGSIHIIKLLVDELYQLKIQVGLQDKIIASFMGDSDSEEFLRKLLLDSSSDNLKLIEVLDSINRLTGKKELSVNTPQT